MNEYWFKPHRYGLGAAPSTWEGWTVIAVYVLAVVALEFRLLAAETAPATFFIAVGLLTAALLYICWRKTEGGWRWRWGGKD